MTKRVVTTAGRRMFNCCRTEFSYCQRVDGNPPLNQALCKNKMFYDKSRAAWYSEIPQDHRDRSLRAWKGLLKTLQTNIEVWYYKHSYVTMVVEYVMCESPVFFFLNNPCKLCLKHFLFPLKSQTPFYRKRDTKLIYLFLKLWCVSGSFNRKT